MLLDSLANPDTMQFVKKYLPKLSDIDPKDFSTIIELYKSVDNDYQILHLAKKNFPDKYKINNVTITNASTVIRVLYQIIFNNNLSIDETKGLLNEVVINKNSNFIKLFLNNMNDKFKKKVLELAENSRVLNKSQFSILDTSYDINFRGNQNDKLLPVVTMYFQNRNADIITCDCSEKDLDFLEHAIINIREKMQNMKTEYGL